LFRVERCLRIIDIQAGSSNRTVSP
jgi:hypothetical protein